MTEVIVVGGGPAGVTAALRARELGATVTLVERGLLGGTCTIDGCVPTRALAKAARLVRDTAQYDAYGLDGTPPRVDFARLLSQVQGIVYQVQERKQLHARLEEAGVRVLARAGTARFLDAHTLAVGTGSEERRLSSDRFILCAGGRARRLACPGAEHALTHGDIWSLPSLPASVAIIGAAATGCQLASVFAAFGARVHLLEVAPRLLAAEDEIVSREVAAAFARRGIAIITGIGGVERIEQHGDGLHLHYTQDGPRSLTVEAVVSAIGWDGNIDSLNLPAAGVATTRSYIAVDDALRTSVPHIFAAGDLTGRMMLVQSAVHEGVLAAENAVLGETRSALHTLVPHGGFTDPEYGAVGPTEAQARATGDCVVATVPYDDLDRGVIDGQTGGACKLIVSRTSRQVLGAHIVGEQAVEVVQVVAAAVRAGQRVEALTDSEFAYPTYTAIVGIAARRIARELGPVGAERPRGAEWEQAGEMP